MKKRLRKLRKRAAFTLVEVLVVLLIIGILVMVLVPNVAKSKDVAEKRTGDAVVKIVETQMELYQLENPGQSPTLAELEKDDYITPEQRKAYEKRKNTTP